MTRDETRQPDPAGAPPTSTDPERTDAADVVSGPVGWAKLRDPATIGDEGEQTELPTLDIPAEPTES